MVITIGGVRVSIKPCPCCKDGRLVRNAAGKIIGHYRRRRTFRRSPVAYETHYDCPSPGQRGVMVSRPYKTAAIMAAIRDIISLQW